MAENNLEMLVQDQRDNEVENAFRKYATNKTGEEMLNKDKLQSALGLLYVPHQSFVIRKPIKYLADNQTWPVRLYTFKQLLNQLEIYSKWLRHMNYVIHQQREIKFQVEFLSLMETGGDRLKTESADVIKQLVNSWYGNNAFSTVVREMEELNLVLNKGISLQPLFSIAEDVFLDFRRMVPKQKNVDEGFRLIRNSLNMLHRGGYCKLAHDLEFSFELCEYSHSVFPRFGSPRVFSVIEKFQEANGVPHKRNISINYLHFITHENCTYWNTCYLNPKKFSAASSSPIDHRFSLEDSTKTLQPVSLENPTGSEPEPPSLFASKNTKSDETCTAKHLISDEPHGEQAGEIVDSTIPSTDEGSVLTQPMTRMKEALRVFKVKENFKK